MKPEANEKKESRLKKRRACWGKMVKGNQAESGCEDCMLRGSDGGVWEFLRVVEGPLPRTVEAAVPVWECLLLLPFFKSK